MRTPVNVSRFRKLIIMASIVSILLISTAAMAETVYKIGVVPQFDAKKIYSIWNPILKELEKQTGVKFKIAGSPNIPAFEKKFQAGEFDFAYMNPYHMLIANKTQGYVPVVRDHGRSLKGILVVKKDGEIKELKDLDGKELAFPAPNALGASLLLRAELAEKHGLKITPKYVKTHNNVYMNVQKGMAAAGGGVGRTFNAQKDNIKNDLKILYTTSAVAPHPLAAHPRVPAEIRDAVKTALLKLGEHESGKKLLKKIPMKKVGEGDLKDYSILNDLGLDKYAVSK